MAVTAVTAALAAALTPPPPSPPTPLVPADKLSRDHNIKNKAQHTLSWSWNHVSAPFLWRHVFWLHFAVLGFISGLGHVCVSRASNALLPLVPSATDCLGNVLRNELGLAALLPFSIGHCDSGESTALFAPGGQMQRNGMVLEQQASNTISVRRSMQKTLVSGQGTRAMPKT